MTGQANGDLLIQVTA